MTVDSLKIKHLQVGDNYIKESLKQHQVAQYLSSLVKKRTGARRVFIVVGIVCGSGVTVKTERRSLWVFAKASKTVEQRSNGDMVVAYRLQEITVDEKLELREVLSYTRGALL